MIITNISTLYLMEDEEVLRIRLDECFEFVDNITNRYDILIDRCMNGWNETIMDLDNCADLLVQKDELWIGSLDK